MKYIYLFICNSEYERVSVLELLHLMEDDLSYWSRVNLSERNKMVTETWRKIMLHFEEMKLEQTVGLILFGGSNYIEYVDCDIEGDVGYILRAKNVVSTIINISLIYFKTK